MCVVPDTGSYPALSPAGTTWGGFSEHWVFFLREACLCLADKLNTCVQPQACDSGRLLVVMLAAGTQSSRGSIFAGIPLVLGAVGLSFSETSHNTFALWTGKPWFGHRGWLVTWEMLALPVLALPALSFSAARATEPFPSEFLWFLLGGCSSPVWGLTAYKCT